MMKKILVCALILIGVSVTAQPWQPSYGPCQNSPWDIKKIHDTLYLASDWANYYSPDNGANWIKINLPAPEWGGPITSFWPIDNDIYFRNYVSHNHGKTWQQTSVSEYLTKYVKSNGTIYALSEYSSIYYSQNNGSSWNTLPALPQGERKGIVVIGSTVYVAVAQQGVFYKNPADTGWYLMNSELPNNAWSYTMEANGQNLYLATVGGLFKCDTTNKTWTYVGGTAMANRQANSVHIYQSTIFVGTDDGVFMADVNSLNWQKLPNCPHAWIFSLLYDGTNLFVGAENNGLYRTNLLGQTWTKLTNGIYAGASVGLLTSANGRVWAATNRLYYSDDLSSGWKESEFISSSYIRSIFATGQDVYFGCDNGKTYCTHDNFANVHLIDSSGSLYYGRSFVSIGSDVFMVSAQHLKMTSDHGATWQTLNTPGSVVSMVAHKGALYITTNVNGVTVYKSSDMQTWASVFSTQEFSYNLTENGDDVFLYGYEGLFHSQDEGGTWNQISLSSLPGSEIPCAVATPDGLYAYRIGRGPYGSEIPYNVYRYHNGAWEFPYTPIAAQSINFLSFDGSRMYAGVNYDGVYYTAASTTGFSFVKNKSNDAIELTLYPNPTDGAVTVKSNSEGRLRLFDATGRCVYSYELKQENLKIELGNQPPGVYVIELQSGDRKVTKKVILE